MAARNLLDRLQCVRETGDGRWVARCPAHEDRSPSLSVRELEDGRVLLHDFGGCDTGSVLAAVGLSLKDLFPDPRPHHLPRSRTRVPAADLLLIIDEEVTVVGIIAAEILESRTIDELAWDRLATAARRIGRVADEVRR